MVEKLFSASPTPVHAMAYQRLRHHTFHEVTHIQCRPILRSNIIEKLRWVPSSPYSDRYNQEKIAKVGQSAEPLHVSTML